MNEEVLIILIHQAVFQGMFLAKNIALQRKVGMPVRGRNKEAILAIGFFGLFILVSILLSFFVTPLGSVHLVTRTTAVTVALVFLALNLLVGSVSLVGLGDSWRVGILEDQKTDLVVRGIYRVSRNPYFLSYLIMFAGYTVLLRNLILLVLSLIGFAMIHLMVLKEEKYLAELHGAAYRQYQEKVPRYIII